MALRNVFGSRMKRSTMRLWKRQSTILVKQLKACLDAIRTASERYIHHPLTFRLPFFLLEANKWEDTRE
jgi:hypothetical protein